MNKNILISIIVLFTCIGLYCLNLTQQKKFNSNSKKFVNIKQDEVKKFIIQSGGDAIEIALQDTAWYIPNHDSLIIKNENLTNFFKKIKKIKSQNLMTTKINKWTKK